MNFEKITLEKTWKGFVLYSTDRVYDYVFHDQLSDARVQEFVKQLAKLEQMEEIEQFVRKNSPEYFL